MKLDLDLELQGIEEALKAWLPAGIKPQRVSMNGDRLRLDGKAPLLGVMTLVAQVSTAPGEMTLSQFDLEGAGMVKGLALAKLKEALSRLDRRSGPFRVWGESDGERLQIRWPAPA